MGFKDELKAFSEIVLEYQKAGNKEVVTDEDAVRSLIVLNYIKYEKVPDAFLGCAAINLLNTYVKQDNAQIGYRFRRHLYSLLKGIEDINQNKTINVFFDDNSPDGTLMIIFWGFQFSFHGEKRTAEIVKLQRKNDIEWDGIRKQLCSKQIFDFALNSDWISNKTQDGKDLRLLIENELTDYNNGAFKFINGELIKTRNVKQGERNTDVYLKNYIRKELEEYQDRPVILIGTFKKIWDKHITFTTIRPYIQGCQSFTICNHINLYRRDVEKVMDIQSLERNNKYFIIGFCEPYKQSDRMGVKLAIDYNFCPIIKAGNVRDIPSDVFSVCHTFSLEKYLSSKQKHLKL